MRRWALAGIVVNVVIMLSGATVRLTESGLGCPTWPRCTEGSLVPVPSSSVATLHMVIEFGNRMLSSVVLAVGLACLLAAVRMRPRRRDLIWLAAALPVGGLAQALIGGFTVLTGLHPAVVGLHFLVSVAIVAAAVGLHHRSTEGNEPARPLVRREITWLARGLIGAVAVVLTLGTVVTGTGPHAGDPDAPRYDFSFEQVAQLHADAVWITLGLTFALVVAVHLTDAPRTVRRRAGQLIALVLAQGTIGYVQLFLSLPEVLVWLHILGSTLVWIAAWRLLLSLRDRPLTVSERSAQPQRIHSDTSPASTAR